MNIDDIAFHNVSNLDKSRLAQSIQSRLALVCPMETAATDAIAIAARSRIPLIVVTTDPRHPPYRSYGFDYVTVPGEPEWVVCGLVEPAHLREAFGSNFRGPAGGALLDTVREYESNETEAKRHWRHEWLNRQGLVLEWCDQGGGHFTKLPCRYHASAAQQLW